MPLTTIGDALFTKTQQRVLGLLYGKPDARFYANEIMRQVNMGRGTVRRELDRLTSAGIIVVSREGNQLYYQANTETPIYSELLAIVRKTFGAADVIRTALQPLDERIQIAFVYGSVAKASDVKTSDIDLMVVGKPTDTVADPACGTGGFLLAAHDYMAKSATSKKEQRHLKENALRGNDIVDSVVRLCAMNLYLHGIGGDECPISSNDALAKEVGDDRVDMVLANPPFGKKSSITVINEKSGKKEQEKLTYEREDFWATTSNKQLNFVQHIANMLKIDGKAAVVVPDNVLFEGGAGETVRKNLLERCDLHTLLRLPTGIFYAQGVKANVIFFDAKPASKTAWTKKLWIYDFRTNVHMTLKTKRLVKSDFDEFIECYKADDRSKRRESKNIERWKSFTYDELIARDKTNLDIFWLKDESLEDTDNLPPPDVLAAEIVEQLEAALEEFRSVEEKLTAEE